MNLKHEIDHMPLEAIAALFTKGESNGLTWSIETVLRDPMSGALLTDSEARQRMELYATNLPTYRGLMDWWLKNKHKVEGEIGPRTLDALAEAEMSGSDIWD